jgi:hypothetical protein
MLASTSPPSSATLSAGSVVRAVSWPAAILVFVSHIAWGDPGWPPEALAAAGLLGAITLVLCAYVRPFVFPIIAVVMVRYYMALGAPVFKSPRLFTVVYGVLPISSRAKIEACVGGLVFGICVLVTTRLVVPLVRRMQGGVSRTLDPPMGYSHNDTIVARFIALLSLASFLLVASRDGRMSELPPSFGLIAALIGNPEYALGFLFWDAYKTRSLSSRVAIGVALTIYTLGGLSTGMVGTLFLPWVGAVVLLWTLYGVFPTRIFAGLLFAVLILNPAKHTYRKLTWNQNHDVGIAERVENWGIALTTMYDAPSQDTTETSSHAADSVGSRMATLVEVAHMFDWIPGKIPYAGADAWLKVPLFFVPTLFWPERPNPSAEFNIKYATTFGIHNRLMTTKAMTTPPSVGDGFWRLGWLGVVLEAVTLGLIVSLFHGLANRASRALVIVGLGYIVSGGGPESCAAAQIAGLPKYLLVLAGVLLVAQWMSQALGGASRVLFINPGARRPQ